MRRMGIGLGVGINRSNYAQGIFGAYATRVVADGGVVEAGACVDAVSSLLQSASLLLIPSGYKSTKLYSEIPTNGNGDLTWTRGSDAFRTNASGLIQRVPWNLLQRSEEFTDALWSKTNATASGNTTTAPNGTTTADSLIEDSTNNLHIASQGISFAGGIYTASVYVKPNGRNWVFINIAAAGSYGAYFDVANGVVGTIQSNITSATMTSVGNGWYRCIVTANTGATSPRIAIYTATANGTNSYQGDGTSGIFIWGAQLVEGTTAQTYLPTTDRLNFPRLDYTYGSCPAVLLEPQRTNLALRSEEFDNAYWGKQSGATVTANTTTSPDGTQNADTINLVSGSTISRIERTGISYSASTSYTLSFYFKNIALTSGQTFAIRMEGSGGFDLVGTIALFNNTNTVVLSGTAGSGFVSSSQRATYDILANGWVRCSIGLTTGTNAGTATVYIISNVDANRSFYAYGAQLELGAYPTTYIPTTSATATRVADSFSRSNIYTNGLITSSGGTWFVELRGNQSYVRSGASSGVFIDTNANGQSSGIAFLAPSGGGRMRIWKVVSGSFATLYNTTTDTTKIAIKWNGTSCDVFANGTKVVSASSFTTTAMENIGARIEDVPYFIQQMALYPEPLTDTKLIELTTL
jgi:hypothetical protein